MKHNAKVYVMAAQKGGVGKSSLIIQSSLICSTYLKKKTLLIDLDPQNNSSLRFASKNKIENHKGATAESLYENVVSYNPIKGEYGIDVIPGSDQINTFPIDMQDNLLQLIIDEFKNEKKSLDDLTANQIIQKTVEKQVLSFVKNINHLRKEYDYIFIDVPPSFLGLPLISALSVATDVIGVLNPDIFSAEVLPSFIQKVMEIKKDYNNSLRLRGFMINNVRGNSPVHMNRVKEWTEELGEQLIGAPIRVSTWVEECSAEGKPVWMKYPSSHKQSAITLLNTIACAFPEVEEIINKRKAK